MQSHAACTVGYAAQVREGAGEDGSVLLFGAAVWRKQLSISVFVLSLISLCSLEIFESSAGSHQYDTAESIGQSHVASHIPPQSGAALRHRYMCSCAGKEATPGGEVFALRSGCAVCAAGRDCTLGQQVQGETGHHGAE